MEDRSIMKFHDVELEIINHEGQMWMTAEQIAKGLGMWNVRSIAKLYNSNKDEFELETCVTETVMQPKLAAPASVVQVNSLTQMVKLQHGGQMREVRIFSPRGAWLIGMFARTEKAKSFRKWILNVLEKDQ